MQEPLLTVIKDRLSSSDRLPHVEGENTVVKREKDYQCNQIKPFRKWLQTKYLGEPLRRSRLMGRIRKQRPL